jgi:hypothetical protein
MPGLPLHGGDYGRKKSLKKAKSTIEQILLCLTNKKPAPL